MALTQVQGGMILASGQSIPSAALPVGSVLQVVNFTNTAQYTTSSATFVTTGYTVSITPKYATSKILILSRIPVRASGTTAPFGAVSWYRGGSALITTGTYEVGNGSGGDYRTIESQIILDSPASASSVTYTLYMVCNGGSGTFYVNPDTYFTSSITLMEIAG